ncbi:hypothetical protein E5Q_00908 [Mixia osmundae IAM 14324]|uniref:Pre-mRNA-processing protein 45 n=1 Tax=Mixia osmundae (strain CBS 9802 / IAM 14324 / JCM 22182 / KY 12970) TaxID=764103 RepID=G7DUJ9_MIXOS|nr:hypothetical protein E5Q_00908 [Mixia osmundae IAM 14324]
MTSVLASLLPAPKYVSSEPAAVDDALPAAIEQTLALRSQVPSYGHRASWRPSKADDFGDGGAYPECHIAQFPLDLGRKKHSSSGNTLALQVDAEGKVRYDAIAHQGHRDGRIIQSQFKDLIPMAHRTDINNAEMERPSEEEVLSTAEKTRLALEKITQSKIKAAQPASGIQKQGKESFIRYTPASGTAGQQRIIRMSEVVEDPLEPPRFKHRKIPRGPPSPPAPILRSPPRKITPQDVSDWMIPPCISNWKNNKGYTIPLDKRLAADGRGLQDVHINDRFATLSESLYLADRHAREEVRQRSQLQQAIAQKEKQAKEENLRQLAQRARDQRSGLPATSTAGRVAGTGGALPAALAGYGSDSDSDEAEQAVATKPRAASESDDDEEDEEEIRKREQMRAERRKERERELRMNNMGTEQRARVMARAQGRDISEKIALGLAKPTLSKESMLDSRLFNQESLPSGFADDDSYNLYDRPLFQGSNAAAAIYKPLQDSQDDEAYGGGNEEGIKKALNNDRFGLGVARKGFEGADLQETRTGPVQFEKDTTADPFGVSAFLDEAKKGSKRGLDQDEASRKKPRD